MERGSLFAACIAFVSVMLGCFCWYQGLSFLRRRPGEPAPGARDRLRAAAVITAGKWAVLGATLLLRGRPEGFPRVIWLFSDRLLLLPEAWAVGLVDAGRIPPAVQLAVLAPFGSALVVRLLPTKWVRDL